MKLLCAAPKLRLYALVWLTNRNVRYTFLPSYHPLLNIPMEPQCTAPKLRHSALVWLPSKYSRAGVKVHCHTVKSPHTHINNKVVLYMQYVACCVWLCEEFLLVLGCEEWHSLEGKWWWRWHWNVNTKMKVRTLVYKKKKLILLI